MSAETWAAALAFVWWPENDGGGFHRDPHDTGGDTNKGVIAATWATAVAHGLVAGDLAHASDADLAAVLHSMFWLPIGGDRLAPGVDLAVFNLAMVAGPGRAALILQAEVGVPQDGIIGPVTLGMASRQPSQVLIRSFTLAEETFFSKCPTAWKFLHGWDRRAEDCRIEAMKLAGY